MKKNILYRSLAALLVLAPVLAFAATESRYTDAMLLLGGAGSQRTQARKDPRPDAVRLLVSLLDSEDRAGLLLFGETVESLTTLGSVGKGDKLTKAAGRATPKGVYADLHLGLSKAMDALGTGSGNRKAIILITDGPAGIQGSKPAGTPDSVQEKLLADLAKSGAAVHSIALSEGIDRRFLEAAAVRTGGSFRMVQSENELLRAVLDVFESLKLPAMMPFSGNRVRVERSTSKFIIVSGKTKPGVTIFLKSPLGREYSKKLGDRSTQWQSSDYYERMQVTAPLEGTWAVLFGAEGDARAYLSSEVRLESDIHKLPLTAKKPVVVKAWLEKAGSIMKDGDLLDGMEMTLESTGSDGTVSQVAVSARDGKGQTVKQGGLFSLHYTPVTPGTVVLRLVAKGRVLEQMKPVVLRVGEAGKIPSLEANVSSGIKPGEKPSAGKAGGAGAASPASQSTDVIDWAGVFGRFLLINAGAAILVYGAVRLMRRKSGRHEHSEPQLPETEKGSDDAQG